jgi:hypothetical protein
MNTIYHVDNFFYKKCLKVREKVVTLQPKAIKGMKQYYELQSR